MPPPGAPLPAGRGEKPVDGEGFQCATELVTNGPADLYFTGGKTQLVFDWVYNPDGSTP